MDPIQQFENEKEKNIQKLGDSKECWQAAHEFMRQTRAHQYTYNFTWMGRPIIQLPQDIIALQEIIWSVQPDLIIETGIAHGGSIIFEASMLELMGGDGLVVGIDIDIRPHNRLEIEKHPMAKRIRMIEGSSIDPTIMQQVTALARDRKRVLVILDSNHTHDHVLQELRLYCPLVTAGSYLVVFDTLIEDAVGDSPIERPWGKGNNPKTAVFQFLKENDRFVIDASIHNKLLITVAPDGFLKCVKDPGGR